MWLCKIRGGMVWGILEWWERRWNGDFANSWYQSAGTGRAEVITMMRGDDDIVE